MVTNLAGPFGRARRTPERKPVLVRAAPLARSEAIVSRAGRTWRAAIGRSGIATVKREGDGATPRGRIVPLLALTRRAVPLPVPARPARRRDGWCDAPASQLYNRAVRLPFGPSHESLVRDDALYDVVVVTDHNQRPRVQGAGSAIFIHVARDGLDPTAGCIAFPLAVWRRGVVPLGPYLVGTEGRPLWRRK